MASAQQQHVHPADLLSLGSEWTAAPDVALDHSTLPPFSPGPPQQGALATAPVCAAQNPHDIETSALAATDARGAAREEAINTPFCPLQEKFNGFVFRGFRNILEPRKIPL